MFLPLAVFDSANVKRLKQFCSGRIQLFINISLYRAIILMISWDISVLFPYGTVKSETGTGLMVHTISALTLAMSKAEEQP